MKLSDKEKNDLVNKLCHSLTFKNAPTSSALLKYLHEATLKGGILKEMVIDIEFFGRNEHNDKSTPKVRVNIYNLRKKIKSYYETEGKLDKWQVSIEKGQYQVSFTKSETSIQRFHHHNLIKTLPYIGLLLAISFIIFNSIAPRPQKIWRSILSSKTNTNLYIGDAFGAVGTTITGGMGYTRDYRINSYADFYKLIDEEPKLKQKLKPSPFTYTSTMGVISVQVLQQFFQRHKHSFAIRFSTRTSTSDIKEGQAIYIGSSRNKTPFVTFFNEGNPYYKLQNQRLHFSGHPNIEDYDYKILSKSDLEEYAIVSKYPGTDDTDHLVFFSEHDIGVSATVDYFTNTDSLSCFTKKHLKNDNYFTAIFQVKGQDRTNTSIKLESVVAF